MQNSDFPNLPKSWQVKTLGEVFLIERGGSPRPIKQFLTNDENGINWIKIGDTKNVSKYIYSTAEKIKPEGKKHSRFVEVGDLILSNSMSFGRPYIMKTTGCIHDGWVVFRNTKKLIDEEYAYYVLTSSQVYAEFSKLATGSTVKNLSIDRVRQVAIPIPPLEIQRRIVKRLDEAFSRIENGTKHLKSAKDNLIKYKQSLLKSAFNGTLTNDSPLSLGESMPPLQSESINTHPLAPSAREGEQEDCHTSKVPSLCGGDLGVGSTHTRNVVDCHESANADSRNDENSPSLAEGARGWVNPRNDSALDCYADKSAHNDDKDTLNGESANLPQGWTIKTLGEVFKVVGGGTPSTTKTEFWNGNIAWITSADIDLQDFTIAPKRFITDEAIRLSTTNLVEKDTIIVVTRVGLGKVGITDRQTCFSQDSQALIPLENINVKFMAFQIKYQAKNFIAVSRGTTISGITKSTLKEVKLVIPPLETQKQIVAILERHFTSADKVSAYIESCLSKAKQLKSSLLKSAFDGTLTNESTHPLAPSAEGGGIRNAIHKGGGNRG